MFTKIVSQLSLSPSATQQLAFYARRLGRERVTRTFSALAAVLVVFLQFGTLVAPPTSANAASPNDIIYGGFTSKTDLLSHYDNSAELRGIYGHWGVTRTDIVNSNEAIINSKDHTLRSIGRLQYFSNDTPITINGTTYWERPDLAVWDTGSFVQTGSNYEVLAGTTADGHYFAIMFACGNLVTRWNPSPPPPPPPPKPTPTPTPTPKPTPTPTPSPKPTPTPKAPSMACTALDGTTSGGQVPLTVDFTGSGTASDESITGYHFAFGDGGTQDGSSSTASHVYMRPGNFTATLTLSSSAGSTTAVSKTCSYVVSVSPEPAAFVKHKYATNLTQNVDATSTPAHGGDTIQYTLVTKNVGGTDASYVVTEHLDYVLEYADVVNSGGGTLNGTVLSWPAQELKAGATITNVFTVQVKNPIPPTPVGTSDKGSFNLVMDNVYGNTVQIQLQPPVAKEVEAASTELPDTGAGTSTTIVLCVAGLTLFFYLRNRQLIREVKLLRRDYEGGIQ